MKCLEITTISIHSPSIFRGSNVIGQIYIIINKMFLYFVENPLQAMTALSLELMVITRDCVSSFLMLCQAFTATDFSCCMFVGLSAFSSVFRKWNKCSIRLESGDWLGHCRIFHFFTFKELLLLYVLGIFWSPFVLWSTAPPNQLCCIWLNLGREYILIHFRIHPSASVLCHVFSKHQ